MTLSTTAIPQDMCINDAGGRIGSFHGNCQNEMERRIISPTHVIRWTFSFVLIAAFGSAAVYADDLEVSSILQFSALDGSASDEDGVPDGVLTLNSLTITGGGELQIDVPVAKILVTGDVSLAGNGGIRTPESPVPPIGPTLTIEAGGNILLVGTSGASAFVMSGTAAGGTVRICAAGDIEMRGRPSIDASSLSPNGIGGTVELRAGGSIRLNAAATRINADGATGGTVRLIACDPSSAAILIKGQIQANGSDGPGGTVEIFARQGGIEFQGSSDRIVANGSTGPGTVTLTAGTSVSPVPPPTDPPAIVSENAPSPLGCDCIDLESLLVIPTAITFGAPDQDRRLAVTGLFSDGSQQDLTASLTGTTYESSDPNVAAVDAGGLVTPAGSNGSATITVANAGVEATVDVTVAIPPATPVLDPHPTMTNQASLLITGSAADGAAIEISGLTGVFTVPISAGAFTADVSLQPNRLNHLLFTAIDALGIRSAPAATTIIQDSQPPSLFIDFPADGSEITTATTDVAGRVGDRFTGFMGLTVTVNGINAIVDVGIGSNGTFFAPDVPLTPGQATVIEATATDELGNVATKEITLTLVDIPPDAPRMAVVSGNGQSGQVNSLLVQPIIVRMTHADSTPFADKIVTFDVTRSDGRLTLDGTGAGSMMLQVRTDANGEARAFWWLGSDAGCGNNRVSATSRDIAGTTFFCATATPAPAAQINIGSGNTQRAEAGGPASEPLQAWVHDGRNAAAGIPVTFTVVAGGGTVNGLGAVTIDTDITGHAEVRFTLGPDGGNHVVEADFPGNPGLPATFITFGLIRDIAMPTSFVGLILDNASRPIEGATCSLIVGSDPPLIVMSDVSGQFRFDDVPGAGAARLVIDALTATGLNGRPIPVGSFPSLHFEPVIVPNAVNSLPMPIALPPLNPNNARVFDNTQDVELTVEGIEGLKMIVKAGSMTRPDGTVPSQADPAIVSLNQVHFDEIPMPMPDGAAPPYAGTLQPAHALFDPPVEIVFPNMSGLPAGSVVYFMSFHETARFEIVGSGTVTPDGASVVSDPGVGLPIGGWHGSCPPYPNTGNATNECNDGSPQCQQCNDAKDLYELARTRAKNAGIDVAQSAAAILVTAIAVATLPATATVTATVAVSLIVINTAVDIAQNCNDPLPSCVQSFFQGTSTGAVQAGVTGRMQLWKKVVNNRTLRRILGNLGTITNAVQIGTEAVLLAQEHTNLQDARRAVDIACNGDENNVTPYGAVGVLIDPIQNRLFETLNDLSLAAALSAQLAGDATNPMRRLVQDFAPVIGDLSSISGEVVNAVTNGVFADDPALFTQIQAIAANAQLIPLIEADGPIAATSIEALEAPLTDLAGQLEETVTLSSEIEDLSHFRNLIVTAASQTAPLSERGEFTLTNIPSNQGPIRLRLQQVPGLGTIARTPFFVPVDQQTVSLQFFEIVDPPELTTAGLDAAPDDATLTALGATTQFRVTATLSDNSQIDVTARTLGSTYQSSNPDIVTVDQEGLVTATGPGLAFITVTNEGATAVARIFVSPGDPLTTVEGFVQLEDGTPVAGADVLLVETAQALLTGPNGEFSFADVPTTLGDLTVLASALVNGELRVARAEGLTPLPAAITDAGVLRLMASELPVVNGLTLWLSADAIPAVGIGRSVNTWPDQSGFGNDFVQVAAAAPPTLVEDVLNGRPVVRFDGVDDGLNAAGQLISVNSFTIFTVMSHRPNGAGGGFWPWQVGGPGGRVFFEDFDFAGNNVDSVDIGHDNSFDARASLPGIGDASFKTMAIVGDRDLFGTSVFVDGVAASMSFPRGNQAWAFGAGGNWLGLFDGSFSNVDFAEFIIYDRVLTDTERNQVEDFLRRKYVNDTVAPTVVGTSPQPDATVGLARGVSGFFDEPIDPSTIDANTFLLLWSGPDGVLDDGNDFMIQASAFDVNPARLVATFQLADPLEAGRYRATLTTGVTDLSGNSLTQDFVWEFTADPQLLPVINGLTVWLSADAIPAVPNGESVNSWPDQSGLGNDFLQIAAAAPPTLVENVINGRPIVRFNGIDDGLNAAGLLVTGNSFTIFTVMSVKPGSIWAWQIGGGTVGNRIFYEDSDFGGPNLNSVDFGHDNFNDARATLPGVADASFKTIAVVANRDIAGTSVFVNGAAAAMQLTGANLEWNIAAGGNWLARFDVPVAFARVDFAEFIVFERALTPTERQSVEDFLRDKYSLP